MPARFLCRFGVAAVGTWTGVHGTGRQGSRELWWGAAAATSLGGECDFRRLTLRRCWEGYGRVWNLVAGPGSRAIRALCSSHADPALGGCWRFAAPIRLRPDFEGCWRAGGLLFARCPRIGGPKANRPAAAARFLGRLCDDTDRPQRSPTAASSTRVSAPPLCEQSRLERAA